LQKRQAAVDQIRKLMLEHGLTTEDIEAKAKAKREGKAASGAAVSAKSSKVSGSLGSKVPPKYQHPETGATWTGRGSAPAWIADAKDRSKFLIASSADAGRAASTDTVSKAKTAAKKASKAVAGAGAHKGQRKGPQPAKYLDPKTGATWSGRGPAPVWLAAAKDRSKFLIAGADAVATEASAASKASKPKSSTVSGAVAKKAVAKKVAAKKVAAKKAIAKKAAPSGKAAPANTLASGTGSTT
jgi:DNA-binding protein H-NS